MAFVKKVVSCRCGRNFYFEFSSDMDVEDLTVSSKCPSCGNGLYVTVSSMGSAQSPAAQAADQQAQPGLSVIPAPSQPVQQNDWNIEDLEHVPPAESTQASEISSGSSLDAGKQISTGSKSRALNDAMNDLFKEE
ncbi:MAG: hypothetical protein WC506_04025 [Candidatus Micrarchaeia archaeon]